MPSTYKITVAIYNYHRKSVPYVTSTYILYTGIYSDIGKCAFYLS